MIYASTDEYVQAKLQAATTLYNQGRPNAAMLYVRILRQLQPALPTQEWDLIEEIERAARRERARVYESTPTTPTTPSRIARRAHLPTTDVANILRDLASNPNVPLHSTGPAGRPRYHRSEKESR
jgi:hypothetical protein